LHLHLDGQGRFGASARTRALRDYAQALCEADQGRHPPVGKCKPAISHEAKGEYARAAIGWSSARCTTLGSNRSVRASIATSNLRCRETYQAERTGILELVEEIDANRVESLRQIGGFAEAALTGHDLKVSGLTPTPEAITLFPETPADRFR
jgi:hypothetical protein